MLRYMLISPFEVILEEEMLLMHKANSRVAPARILDSAWISALRNMLSESTLSGSD